MLSVEVGSIQRKCRAALPDPWCETYSEALVGLGWRTEQICWATARFLFIHGYSPQAASAFFPSAPS